VNRFGHGRIWPLADVFDKKGRLVDFTNKADFRTAGN